MSNGNEPLGGVLVAVDAEGDADAPEHEFGLGAARGEELGRRFVEPARDLMIERPRRTAGNPHLVERRHSACPNPLRQRRQARTTLRLGNSPVATSVPSPRARVSASAPRIAAVAGHAPKFASICSASASRSRNASREISTAPRLARCSVLNWASSSRKPPSPEAREQMDERDLRGVAGAMEHALAEEGAAQAHAIEAADQLIALVSLERMGVAGGEQFAIEPHDLVVDPGLLALRAGAHDRFKRAVGGDTIPIRPHRFGEAARDDEAIERENSALAAVRPRTIPWRRGSRPSERRRSNRL